MQSIFKIVMQGPLGEDLTGSPEDLLTRTWTRSCTARTSYIFHQAPLIQYIASARSSCKDLLERTLPGSPQDLLIRTGVRSCKDLAEHVSSIFTRSSHKDLLAFTQGPLARFHHSITSQGLLQGLGQDLDFLVTSEFAPWNACKIVIEGPSTELKRFLYQDLRESDIKVHTAPQRERSDKQKVTRGLRETKPGGSSCASLRSRNAHGHLARALLCENLRWKNRRPDGAPWSNHGLWHLP